jgi:hypothetical protein
MSHFSGDIGNEDTEFPVAQRQPYNRPIISPFGAFFSEPSIELTTGEYMTIRSGTTAGFRM